MLHWQVGIAWVGSFIVGLSMVLGITASVLRMMLKGYPTWEECRSTFQSQESCNHYHIEQNIRNDGQLEAIRKLEVLVNELIKEVQAMREMIVRMEPRL